MALVILVIQWEIGRNSAEKKKKHWCGDGFVLGYKQIQKEMEKLTALFPMVVISSQMGVFIRERVDSDCATCVHQWDDTQSHEEMQQ